MKWQCYPLSHYVFLHKWAYQWMKEYKKEEVMTPCKPFRSRLSKLPPDPSPGISKLSFYRRSLRCLSDRCVVNRRPVVKLLLELIVHINAALVSVVYCRQYLTPPEKWFAREKFSSFKLSIKIVCILQLKTPNLHCLFVCYLNIEDGFELRKLSKENLSCWINNQAPGV